MTYPYGTRGAPAVGGGAPGLPRRGATRGEISWTVPGTYTWTVPDDFPSDVVHAVVCGGGGGSWANTAFDLSTGAGGGLAWKNNIPVVPGMQITVVVGDRGLPAGPGLAASAGGTSYFVDTSTCAASGGAAGASGVTAAGGAMLAGDGGGTGGNGASLVAAAVSAGSGGGAAGYSGNGGAGAAGTGDVAGNAGTGGGGGSGGAAGASSRSGGSGGVGMFGEGTSGTGGAASAGNGSGGSGGQDGRTPGTNYVAGYPGLFGAGGGAATVSTSADGYRTNAGASGFVRIVWGPDRAFPSTDVGPS